MSTSANRSSNTLGRPPRSAGGLSIEGSDDGSVVEEEYTTALPAWSSKEKEGKDKDRRERGLRGVLPFPRKRKDKEKGKDRDRSTDRNSGKDRSGSALGEYAHVGSLRGKGTHRERHGREEREEEL
jgi:hypothetical protein|tara:strand:- start:474 stop:851 length:378 start_codon:yes stop_codon:yes gene_type:complete